MLNFFKVKLLLLHCSLSTRKLYQVLIKKKNCVVKYLIFFLFLFFVHKVMKFDERKRRNGENQHICVLISLFLKRYRESFHSMNVDNENCAQFFNTTIKN